MRTIYISIRTHHHPLLWMRYQMSLLIFHETRKNHKPQVVITSRFGQSEQNFFISNLPGHRDFAVAFLGNFWNQFIQCVRPIGIFLHKCNSTNGSDGFTGYFQGDFVLNSKYQFSLSIYAGCGEYNYGIQIAILFT